MPNVARVGSDISTIRAQVSALRSRGRKNRARCDHHQQQQTTKENRFHLSIPPEFLNSVLGLRKFCKLQVRLSKRQEE
jgi:hypothetical protein